MFACHKPLRQTSPVSAANVGRTVKAPALQWRDVDYQASSAISPPRNNVSHTPTSPATYQPWRPHSKNPHKSTLTRRSRMRRSSLHRSQVLTPPLALSCH